MYIPELKQMLKKYSQDDLILLMVEMYKAIPKKLREENDIDLKVQNFEEYLDHLKPSKPLETKADLKTLRPEIEEFLSQAYAKYYFVPNNIISRHERPRWRYKVKQYLKSLESISPEDDDGKAATELMRKLYEMLCCACHDNLFRSNNPFQSVGAVQAELYETIVRRLFCNTAYHDVVKAAIEMAADNYLDTETLDSDLAARLVNNLKNPMEIKTALLLCRQMKGKTEIQIMLHKDNNELSDWESRMKIRRFRLIEMAFLLHSMSGEYDAGVAYVTGNCGEAEPEGKLFKLLSLMHSHKRTDDWIKEYEKAVNNGVTPRDSLQKTYEYVKLNGKLPKLILG